MQQNNKLEGMWK